MITITLTEQELQILKVFLGRVSLQGSEVPAFVELVNKVNLPIDRPPKGMLERPIIELKPAVEKKDA